MSYAVLVKKWKREYKIKLKNERFERRKQKERELKFADELFIARMKEEKRQAELFEKRAKEISIAKDNILLALQKSNPFTYPQYLIIWDIINTDYDQIMSDYNRERVTKQEILDAIEYVENFNSDIINKYWKNELLTVKRSA